ncbi:tRNA pseudouridine(38-40) synthase TruA [Chloroflexota bacterium]
MVEQNCPTRTIICVIEYDGTRYHGFQLQAQEPTIQSELEQAIEKLTGRQTRIIGASRTDSGVHAREQVIGFRTRSALLNKNFVDGLNHYLPQDIAIKAARQIDSDFGLRKEAKNRIYRYRVLNTPQRSALEVNRAYQVGVPLDVDAMHKASQELIGTADFASFTQSDNYSESTVRTVYEAKVSKEVNMVLFDIKADSFLKQQVRRTVGTLLRVGTGELTIEAFRDIINAKQNGLAGPTAPPYGLYLMKVNYDIELYGEEK